MQAAHIHAHMFTILNPSNIDVFSEYGNINSEW